jgi:hypothetical protein
VLPRYRNQAVILLFSSIGLFVLALGIYHLGSVYDFRRVGGFFAVICTVVGVVLYQWGSIVLAKAKGYSSDVPAGVITVGILCCGFIFFISPFIILFLKDKTRRSRRSTPLKSRDQKSAKLAAWSIALSLLAWIALICAQAIPQLHTPKDTATKVALTGVLSTILLATIMAPVFATFALRRDKENTLAIISICLISILLLMLTPALIAQR